MLILQSIRSYLDKLIECKLLMRLLERTLELYKVVMVKQLVPRESRWILPNNKSPYLQKSQLI